MSIVSAPARMSLSVALSIAIAAGVATGPASLAAAQGLQLNRFAAPNAPEDMFQTESPVARGHDFWGAQAVLDYSASPLVFTPAGSTDRVPVVEHQLTLHAGLSYSLFDRLLLYGALPIHLLQAGQEVPGVPGPDESSLSDPTLGARVLVYGDPLDAFGIALAADVTFPLAQAVQPAQSYSGDQSVNFVPKLIAEFRPPRLRVTANVGVRLREEYTSSARALVRSELLWRAGVGYELLDGEDEVEAILEAAGNHALDYFARDSTTNIELLLGIKYFSEGGLTAGIAAGPGLTAGWGTPAVRVMMSVGYIQPEPEPEPVADIGPVDGDEDGYPDDEDDCPEAAEDLDQFEDEDGCPDLDNDGDGVLDADDQCPNEAEDLDEFEDEDGCPDPDNDDDEIVDADDQCPNDAEDVDAFQDEDGCPDPDNDGDGVADIEDPCPLAVGTPANGGCPSSLRFEDGEMRLLTAISFAPRRATLTEGGEAVLEDVRATLAANRQVRRVRIDAHTDDRGPDARNLTLSRERARGVVTWMVEHGLEASRLEAWGCGEARPLAEGTSREARAQNDRIEFHIVDPATEGTPSTEGCELSVEAAQTPAQPPAAGPPAE